MADCLIGQRGRRSGGLIHVEFDMKRIPMAVYSVALFFGAWFVEEPAYKVGCMLAAIIIYLFHVLELKINALLDDRGIVVRTLN